MKFYNQNYFYYQNYDIIYEQFLTSNMQAVILGSELPVKKCRFCNKENAEYDENRKQKVTFKKNSHVIPEALGNKKLFMNYECDLCNAEFGDGIENQFGNWSKPMRTLYRLKGKKGVPTFKNNSKSNSGRIEYKEEKLISTNSEDDLVHTFDETQKKITYHLKRDTYIPRDVLKTFVKMGVSLIPDNELTPFEPLIKWIKGDETIDFTISINHTFRPGVYPNDFIFLTVLRRKKIINHVPYAVFILSYGNDIFQLPLTAVDYDQKLNGCDIDFPFFFLPNNTDFDPLFERLNLNNTCAVKNEQVLVDIEFSEVNKITI
ncbi:HNH endonuclease [Commensalibacter papalotli (ex Servin-Garciduenas et al. 2014)]|uniref:HNH endonuclease 5 domain-containing protein n=1 Tax=Commensalibacter papalotli (ex Servin-Garciduenas et al. 2014) TaxID=1208583 RepID=W7E7Q3_9PROT|nr:HNH endonuclease [Commensalibacter papalotli (ex Servin-Garciduenas et al. 2014)]EUK19151.1 hypothetical protein COMX_05355 [Commensalibacter papalotli (ex Servin-Garciduenas et al. 2014)]